MIGTSLQSGVCFAAYPDAKVAGELSRWIGCQRHVINCKVEEDKARAKAYIEAKVFGPVQPSFPDQACSPCGHTHADNRRAQRFVCLKCGLALHAGENAARGWKSAKSARRFNEKNGPSPKSSYAGPT
jgi:hypothetical protein